LTGGKRDDVVLATKVWGAMGEDPNQRGVSRRWIIREVENSLRRLGTDWIDLYQIHRYEPDVDIEETLGALFEGGAQLGCGLADVFEREREESCWTSCSPSSRSRRSWLS
jgi:aryl-alcohol dehydrogenase-like predicted oxidoreductase